MLRIFTSSKNTSPNAWKRQARIPSHAKRMRHYTMLAFGVSLTLLVIVGAILTVRLVGYWSARDEYTAYQAMEEEATDPPKTAVPEQSVPPMDAVASQFTAIPTTKPFSSMRVTNLKKENRDTVGWIDIIGTEMKYPVVQGTDNKYYMHHTFKKKKNASGAIFLDCWNKPDFTDFNTVIYGHNMKDGSMFNGLREYRHQRFADEHSFVEITLQNKKLCYRIFAAYTSQGEDSADFRGQSCITEKQRSEFIKAARKRSTNLTSSATVSRHDRLLTLVTCTGGEHPWFWVVHAVLAETRL